MYPFFFASFLFARSLSGTANPFAPPPFARHVGRLGIPVATEGQRRGKEKASRGKEKTARGRGNSGCALGVSVGVVPNSLQDIGRASDGAERRPVAGGLGRMLGFRGDLILL